MRFMPEKYIDVPGLRRLASSRNNFFTYLTGMKCIGEESLSFGSLPGPWTITLPVLDDEHRKSGIMEM
jgi:hypothetical protein